MARDLLVLERGILEDLQQIEVDAGAIDSGDVDIRRSQRDACTGHHAVEQQRSQRATDC